jgi:hypothetical protein
MPDEPNLTAELDEAEAIVMGVSAAEGSTMIRAMCGARCTR